MDIPPTTHLSLCSGYGGIDLGLRRAIGKSLRTVAYAEIEAFACELLLARMEGRQIDPAPIWPDLKSFPWESLRDRVDILSGGYPCQPFSAAGKRLGKEDPRHLWPYIADGIRILRPKLCFFENVEGHISLGLRDVIEELGRLGYSATWGIFSASEVGAPHQRKRVFILAYRNNTGLERYWRYVAEHDSQGRQAPHGQPWPSRPGQPQHEWEPPRVVGNSNSLDRSASPSGREHDSKARSTSESLGDTEGWQDNGRIPGDMEGEAGEGECGDDAADGAGESMVNATSQRLEGGQQSSASRLATEPASSASRSRQTQPPLGGDADGTAGGMGYAELQVSCDNRTDELRLLGNGVVPATATLAFCTLMNQLTNNT